MSLRSLSLVLAAALLAACSQDSTTPGAPGTGSASASAAASPGDGAPAPASATAAGGSGIGGIAATVAARGPAAIGANPDRGDLVAYEPKREAERRGARTFHPVRISEDHALAAIGGGTLHITGPDGRQVELVYDRHVEHPSGDWSWIGHDRYGVDAVLTFGERAVFGVIPYGKDDSLRLTTSNGQAWMATTEKGELSALQQRIRSGVVGPDFRMPTAAGVASALAADGDAGSAAAARTAGAPVQAMAATTIDVLVGYTPGFVTMMGGASQAQTRLNHLITVGNQAFANSSVDVGLRMVGSMQVNYPDTGTNQNALYQVTGSNGSSPVTVPASLQPLRAARETHGADLVVLVRRFRDPEHDGCGIAWLLGGDQQPIVEGHKAFGYSAISDSNGMGAPDNGHFCRDETLVHEIGHNMGSQHDDANARDEQGMLQYGRYPYSFGYKTTSGNGNFYTVMAYGDAGQTAYRIFSNPQSTFCGGRACGIADQADNARSLRQTGPVIASFRASVFGGAARSDVNGDGISDLVWRHAGNGQNTIWLSANRSTPQLTDAVANLSWKLVGVDDFTGDGRADLLWRNEANGQNVVWPAGSRLATITLATVPGTAWQVVGTGDFDGDGMADILWRNSANGMNSIWGAANRNTPIVVHHVSDLAWRVVGVGDTDGDGRDDIVWRNSSNGQNTIWRSAQRSTQTAVAREPNQAWRIVGVDDFDGDGRADLLWRKSTDGQNVIWRSGNKSTGQVVATVDDTAWVVAATGDYNGDGRADIVWRHSGSGANTVWLAANRGSQWVLPSTALSWQIKP